MMQNSRPSLLGVRPKSQWQHFATAAVYTLVLLFVAVDLFVMTKPSIGTLGAIRLIVLLCLAWSLPPVYFVGVTITAGLLYAERRRRLLYADIRRNAPAIALVRRGWLTGTFKPGVRLAFVNPSMRWLHLLPFLPTALNPMFWGFFHQNAGLGVAVHMSGLTAMIAIAILYLFRSMMASRRLRRSLIDYKCADCGYDLGGLRHAAETINPPTDDTSIYAAAPSSDELTPEELGPPACPECGMKWPFIPLDPASARSTT